VSMAAADCSGVSGCCCYCCCHIPQSSNSSHTHRGKISTGKKSKTKYGKTNYEKKVQGK
jgi:hypothetical protein